MVRINGIKSLFLLPHENNINCRVVKKSTLWTWGIKLCCWREAEIDTFDPRHGSERTIERFSSDFAVQKKFSVKLNDDGFKQKFKNIRLIFDHAVLWIDCAKQCTGSKQ